MVHGAEVFRKEIKFSHNLKEGESQPQKPQCFLLSKPKEVLLFVYLSIDQDRVNWESFHLMFADKFVLFMKSGKEALMNLNGIFLWLQEVSNLKS